MPIFGRKKKKEKKKVINLKDYEKELRNWVEDERRKGVPLQRTKEAILEKMDTKYTREQPFEVFLLYRQVAGELDDILFSRNNQGSELEKEGRIDEAIQLYEQNARDLVDTPFTYNRLRIIYTKRKDYQNAIRVCRVALSVYGDVGKMEHHLKKLLSKV